MDAYVIMRQNQAGDRLFLSAYGKVWTRNPLAASQYLRRYEAEAEAGAHAGAQTLLWREAMDFLSEPGSICTRCGTRTLNGTFTGGQVHGSGRTFTCSRCLRHGPAPVEA